MVMRLVPQDELLDEEEIQALEQQTLQAESGRARAEEDELAEAQDGAVENGTDEAATDGSDGAAATAEPAINLPLMEALLLSTHHPLTAGRLAELLDLESTKPIRKAIKG